MQNADKSSMIGNLVIICLKKDVRIFLPLADTRYLSFLMILLGVSFQLSVAAVNIIFYLIVLSSIAILLIYKFEAREIPWRGILHSRLWQVVAIWIVLLYLSITYSDAQELLTTYARKYIKYIFLGILAVMFLMELRRGNNPAKPFFLGLIIGGVISFTLAAINSTTGLLTEAANQGWFSRKYIISGFWTSNEIFAYSLLMAVVFLYGVVKWLQGWRLRSLALCGISVFCVFVVSYQRTGFVGFFVLLLWLILLLLPTKKQKFLALLIVALVTTAVLSTKNDVSNRTFRAVNEVERCLRLDDKEMQDTKKLGKACRTSNGLRVLFYHDGLQQISRSWIYGHGMADLEVRSLKYDKKNKKIIVKQTRNPHNEYLLQGIQLGLVGIVLIVLLFAIAYYQSMTLNSPRRYLYAGTILMCAVSCLFNSFLLDVTQGILVIIILSFIIAEHCYQQEEK